MLKISIPKEAVRHKMTQNGISKRIVAAVLSEPLSHSNETSKTARPTLTKERSLIALHWTPLSPNSAKGSIWGKVMNKDGATEPQQSDITKLEELFRKKKKSRTAHRNLSDKSVTATGSDKSMAKLLDVSRANNIGISLKAFKDFTYEALGNALADLDPEQKIVGERVQFIHSLLPTEAEAALIRSYEGTDSTLAPAELFFRQLSSVHRIREKVYTIKTMRSFEEHARAVTDHFQKLSAVCHQVMQSDNLAQVLETILSVGNIMNEGTRSGGAAGFKLDSLLKLTQTKSADGKLTVLDYIVMIFAVKSQRDVLNLTLEFPNIQVASRIIISELMNDVKSMCLDLKKCQFELDSMKRDQSSDKGIISKKKNRRSMFAGQRKDSMSSILSDVKSAGDVRTAADSRNSLLAAIRERGSEKHIKIDECSSNQESIKSGPVKYSRGVVHLENLMKDARAIILC